MSIIEKAVNKLEKKPEKSVENDWDSIEAASAVMAEPQVNNAGESASLERAAVTLEHSEIVQVEPHTAQSKDDSNTASAKKRVSIPFADLESKGILSPAVPRGLAAEEFRTIKRPILKNIAGESAVPIENPNLVMVTSALQGDGKTFASINLAMSIAMEQDKTVLFVDADVSKASAGRMLGVPSQSPGLIDVLEDKGVELPDVILRTTMDKLAILPAGNVHERANELLASESMLRLMLELSQRYSDRVIVFDSPPLLLTTEAGVLAGLMGQVVFVARADKTPQHAITEALEHIAEDKVVGMILNGTHRRRSSLFGYGYGYGYGNGYGYGGREPDSASETANGVR